VYLTSKYVLVLIEYTHYTYMFHIKSDHLA